MDHAAGVKDGTKEGVRKEVGNRDALHLKVQKTIDMDNAASVRYGRTGRVSEEVSYGDVALPPSLLPQFVYQ